MLTTTAMVKMGKVYENMMVDLQLTNKKLVERAKRIIMIATGVNYPAAGRVPTDGRWACKNGYGHDYSRVTAEEARERIRLADGFVRLAIRPDLKESEPTG